MSFGACPRTRLMWDALQCSGYCRPIALVTENPQSPPCVTIEPSAMRYRILRGWITIFIVPQLKHQLVTCFSVFCDGEPFLGDAIRKAKLEVSRSASLRGSEWECSMADDSSKGQSFDIRTYIR